MPAVKEPSKRRTPWFTVLASMVCSQRSSRLARRVGICMMFGAAWWHAAVGGAEVCVFKCVVELVFVFFGYVENEWSKAGVFVGAVLFPCGCASDGDDDACCGFADFYG